MVAFSKPLVHGVSGALGGLVSLAIVFPLERLTALLQTEELSQTGESSLSRWAFVSVTAFSGPCEICFFWESFCWYLLLH